METSREESLPCPDSTDCCKHLDCSVRSALRIRSCTSNSIYDVHGWYWRDHFLCSTRNGTLLCIKEIRKDIICTVNSRLPLQVYTPFRSAQNHCPPDNVRPAGSYISWEIDSQLIYISLLFCCQVYTDICKVTLCMIAACTASDIFTADYSVTITNNHQRCLRI